MLFCCPVKYIISRHTVRNIAKLSPYFNAHVWLDSLSLVGFSQKHMLQSLFIQYWTHGQDNNEKAIKTDKIINYTERPFI